MKLNAFNLSLLGWPPFIRKLIMVINFTTILMIFALMQVRAEGFSQINLNKKNASLSSIFKSIEAQTNYVFFSKDYNLKNIKIDLHVENASIESTLNACFKGLPFTYKIVDKTIAIKKVVDVFSTTQVGQIVSRPITGIVTDEKGLPIAGVSIRVKGSNLGAVTDEKGAYTLNVTDENAILIFSYIGFIPQEVAISGRQRLPIILVEDMSKLNEIVVVGYGTQKKVNLTGAVDVISGEVLENRASSNVGSLLQGVSPNLNISVTNGGGEPGAPTTFNIRGIGSLTGGGPLILVDGVEMNINNLDPESIESVSVLKDAAAAAVYGSRAPFGVVLITTKRGTKNKGVSIGYTNNISASSPMYLPKWHDALKYVTAYNQTLKNSNQPDKFPAAQIDRIKRYMEGTYLPEYDTIAPPNSLWRGRHEGNANYDWFDEYFKDHSINQKHNISLSGGDEKTQYYLSTGYFNQGTSYNWVDEHYKRYNVLANISAQATSWLRLNLNTKYSNTDEKHPLGPSGLEKNQLISEFMKFFPTTPMYNVNGTINNPYVIQMMHGGKETFVENDLFITLGGELEPIKGWKTNFNYSYNYTGSQYTKHDKQAWFEIPNGTIANIGAPQSGFTQNWAANNYNALNATSSYEVSLNDHNIKAMAGYEREAKYFSSLFGNRRELITEEVPSISTATGVFNVDDSMSHWGTEAFFGRINYNFKEKYLFEVNGRYNGSSRFSKDSRWGFFPSVSAGYNISKENFWEPISDIVNNLKIRASYGSLGNQNVRNYLYLSNIPISNNLEWIIDGQRPNFAGIPNIISPTLTWETITTLNIGVDATFLRNRLGVGFDWFERNTSDMFGPAIILPNALGATPPQENNASLSTKGWELVIDWNDRIGDDLRYNLKLSLADSKSKITKYLNETGTIDGYYVGKDYGEIWGYETDGIIQDANEVIPDQSKFYNSWGPGDIKYKDLDGNNIINDGKRTLSDHGDVKVIGNSSPRYTIGFTGSVSWKNFDFSMFWQGILKRDLVVSGTAANSLFWGIGSGGESFFHGHEDYWRPADETNILGPNTDAYYPKPYATAERAKSMQIQSKYILDASYIRLKNIQIGYTLPALFSNKIKISRFKVYVSGENLLTFSNLTDLLDPEIAYSSTGFTGAFGLGRVYPLSKSLSVGLNLTF